MEQLTDIFQRIIDFVLGNIGIVIFAIFLLTGLLGRGDRNKEQKSTPPQEQRNQPAGQQDNRPLAERLAEYFGVEIPEDQPQRDTKQPTYASEGRRSTVRRSVQDQYPELFGGSGMFDRSSERQDDTKWGFDDTEWGSTFEKSEEQWGNTFPDRKSSEPRIEWPN